MSQTILVVDDEMQIVRVLRGYLEQAGYRVITAYNGEEALYTARQERPDLVILDLQMPKMDGLEFTRRIRAERPELAILMLTARVEELDRILGLELGADDYVTKPFSPREVVARVKAMFRRLQRTMQAGGPPALIIDESAYRASFNGHVLDLTPVEFRLLKALAEVPGRVLSREQLLDRLYSDHRVVTDRTVDSHVKNLRRKMELVASDGQEPIRSIYGVGYKLEI